MAAESMQRAYAALGNLPVAEWLAAFTPELTANPHRTGAHYLPELEQTSRYRSDQGVYGGFFPPVTPESLNESVQALFADTPDQGQWLTDYLERGTIPQTDAQRLFVQRYDQLMLGMLDASYSGEDNSPLATSLRSFDFVSIANDETLTDTEFFQTISRMGGVQEDLARMGDPLAMQWVLFSGGVVQGIIDFEPDTGRPLVDRYTNEEFSGLVSPLAQTALILQNRGTLAGFTDSYPLRQVSNFSEALPSAVSNMESICTSPTDSLRFRPSATPVYTPDTGLER